MSSYKVGAYTAPSEELTAKWNIGKTQYNLSITLYIRAFDLAPMMLALFSETNRRRPIFIISRLIFLKGEATEEEETKDLVEKRLI